MRRRDTKKRRRGAPAGDLVKGVVAGLAGGLVASWAMNQFQSLVGQFTAEEGREQPQPGEQRQGGGKDRQPQDQAAKAQDHAAQEPATEKAAAAISERVFAHELTNRERKQAGPIVHYAMGATSGVLYGAAAELVPTVTVGAGLPFGAAVWLIADELTVPALGLSKAPAQYPLSNHVYALTAHFVYGLTTDLVRRTVRNAL
jgi:putative membrane protein